MRTPRAAAYSTGQERLRAGLQAKLEDLYNWHYKNRQRRIGGWPDDHVGMAPCTVHCMAMRTPRATRAWCIAHRIPNPYDWAMARTRTRGNNRRPAVIRMHGSPRRGGHIPPADRVASRLCSYLETGVNCGNRRRVLTGGRPLSASSFVRLLHSRGGVPPDSASRPYIARNANLQSIV